jgi:hypothetical protein
MKYTILENPDGTHTLLRYGKVATPINEIPNNVEFEFWQRIKKLEEGYAVIANVLDEMLADREMARYDIVQKITEIAKEALKDE